ncbi:DUF2897 family protein [Photobacterium sagamiensis]|uniref:DUF2897 domain-containing protein n=1 Tax=Photobacterium lipolyticum TaxID=266810 RepID=A0A2T3N5F9_9GAMM|nr:MULTISPECIES: DUF2897 family protein [Photobacterium]MDX1302416.1 DUF2897 family protein [Photobacterium sp.]PSW07657.1 DUF2897 domain-containing protein [Photobacterium lipolyticum]
MEWLLNPWVISAIVLSVVVSNIMALKYTANMKFGYRDKAKYLKEKHDREKAEKEEQDPSD